MTTHETDHAHDDLDERDAAGEPEPGYFERDNAADDEDNVVSPEDYDDADEDEDEDGMEGSATEVGDVDDAYDDDAIDDSDDDDTLDDEVGGTDEGAIDTEGLADPDADPEPIALGPTSDDEG